MMNDMGSWDTTLGAISSEIDAQYNRIIDHKLQKVTDESTYYKIKRYWLVDHEVEVSVSMKALKVDWSPNKSEIGKIMLFVTVMFFPYDDQHHENVFQTINDHFQEKKFKLDVMPDHKREIVYEKIL